MICEYARVCTSSCTGYALNCMVNINIFAFVPLLLADWHTSPASPVGNDALAALFTLLLSDDLDAQGTLRFHTSAPEITASVIVQVAALYLQSRCLRSAAS